MSSVWNLLAEFPKKVVESGKGILGRWRTIESVAGLVPHTVLH